MAFNQILCGMVFYLFGKTSLVKKKGERLVLDTNNDAKFLNLDLFWYFVMSFFHSPEFNGKEYFSDVKNLDPIAEW